MDLESHQITLYGQGSLPSGLEEVEERIFVRVEGVGDVSTVERCGDNGWRIVLEFETTGSFMSMLRAVASVLTEENVPPSSVKVLVRGRTYTLSRLLGVDYEI